MVRIVLLIVGVVISVSASAVAVDVYGTDQRTANQIVKNYGEEIAALETVLKKEGPTLKAEDAQSKSHKKLVEKRLALIEQITNKYKFLRVDFQTIFYPDDNSTYTTIEVIDKGHPERLRFLNVTSKANHVEKKKKSKPDLIDAMKEYDNTAFDLLVNHRASLSFTACPVYHCAIGFGHPKLKPYLALFNKGAVKEKSLIINTLSNDSDPERRAAAAFLIGHFRDPHEIISILSQHVDDKNDGVRNNVMRVIGATMAKAKINEIDVMPFIRALSSPYTTDRNKALFVLLSAAESEASKSLILQKGGTQLVELVRLKQPNNHYSAYLILKKISGKDYGETGYNAWSTWVSSAKKQAV